MKRFKFKFAAVLKLRKSREESALTTLGAAQRAYQAELAKKNALIASLNQALERREDLGSVATAIVLFKTEQDFIIGTKVRITQADQAIARATRNVEKALRVYLQARRQTRMIESLYEKEHAEWRRASIKREEKELDDITAMRARFAKSEDSIIGEEAVG